MVTVTVWEAGPDQWKMQVADDTNGLAFTMPPEPYAMGMAGGRQTSLWRMLMMQGGQQVSTPSAFSPEGFSVSYTGPRPAGSGART
jgi:hypothetical protein